MPSDYGILETLAVAIFFIAAVFNLGLDSASGRYFFMAKSKEEKGKVLFTVFVFRLIIIVPSLILAFFSNQISLVLFKTTQYSWVVFLSCLLLPLELMNNEQSHIYRYYRRPWEFNLITILKMFAHIGAGISLVIILKKGVLGAQLATFISGTILFLFSFMLFNRKRYTYNFSFYWAKRMVKFGFPLIFTGIISWFYLSSDRFFLLHYQDTTEIGLYSIGSTIAQPLLLLNMAVQMSFGPIYISLYENEVAKDKSQTKKVANQIWYFYLFISISIALFLSIFSVDIIKILAPPAYIMGALVIPLLLFSHIINQSMQLTAFGMFLKEKMGHFVWFSLVTAAVNVGLNFYFVPKYSFVGAAFTTLIASVVYYLLAYNVSQRYFYVERKIVNFILYYIIALGVASFFPFAELKYNIPIALWQKAVVFILALTFPLITGIINLNTLKNTVFRELKISRYDSNV